MRYLLAGISFVFVVAAAAIAGYLALGWSFSDALYMTVMTVFTVGYGEVHPIDTPALRTLTITLIVVGCTGMIFVTGALVQLITASTIQNALGQRRMNTDIDRLRDHVIICGFGRIGQMLARTLHAGGARFIVLERSEHRAAQARAESYLALQADATDEEVLTRAGVAHARVLATVLPDDAANVFITLSARNLNPGLTIIARGEATTTERKLRHAGANQVIMPAHIGAERMAELILYPVAREAVETDLHTLGLRREVIVADATRFAGLTIEEAEREARDFLIIAIERQDGTAPPTNRIEPGDGVVIVKRDP